MRGLGLLASLAAFAVFVAWCNRRAPEGAAAHDAGAAAASASASGAPSAGPPPAMAPARCSVPEAGAGAGAGASATVPDPEDLEIGDALAFGEGYAVALAHRTGGGRHAAVALLARTLSSVRLVDLGPTLGDAPAPHLALRGAELLAASYALAAKGDARELRVQSVDAAGGEPRLVATVPQQRDDSLAFDLGPALVAWDETVVDPTAKRAPRGVIRVATLAADHAGTAHDASPADSDAEMPRLVGAGSRTVLLWIARRSDEPAGAVGAAAKPDAAPVAEAVGELPAHAWIEATSLDANGLPAGVVRKLTPATGHVSAYDAMAERGASAAPGGAVVVIARDDGESVDGSGGTLLRVRLTEAGADPALGLPGDGLGRGAPLLVEAPLPWLVWTGPREELRLLPLDAQGVPVAPPSAEPALGESRPLLVTAEGAVLAGFPGDAAAPLRAFSCAR